MKKVFLLVVLSSTIILSGCLASLQQKATNVVDQLNPFAINDVKIQENDFDGSVQKFVKPGPVHKSQDKEFMNVGHNAEFALGATWSSAKPDQVILVSLQLKLTRPFTKIEFNIDGEVSELTNFGRRMMQMDQSQLKFFNENYNQRSLQFYAVSLEEFNKIVDDGKAKIRQYYSDGYFNGDLSIEDTNAAIIGLRNLQTAIKQTSP